MLVVLLTLKRAVLINLVSGPFPGGGGGGLGAGGHKPAKRPYERDWVLVSLRVSSPKSSTVEAFVEPFRVFNRKK